MRHSPADLIRYTNQALQVADGALDALDALVATLRKGEAVAAEELSTIADLIPATRTRLADIRRQVKK